MSTIRPKITDDPMYQLLREERIEEFNELRKNGEKLDFSYCDFRNLDLRGMNAANIDFSHAYFRQSDLRGIDFSQSRLEGSSINSARISGVYFPVALSADEITLSLLHGTRMRYRYNK